MIRLRKTSIIAVTILTLAASCSTEKAKDVAVSLKDNFPVLRISNNAGYPIYIAPENQSTGSIGFIVDNNTVWVNGAPGIEVLPDSSSLYSWSLTDNLELRLNIKIVDGDFKFYMDLNDPEVNKNVKAWLLNIKTSHDEYFTGAFERVVDGIQDSSWVENIKAALNLRGQRVEVKLKPTVSAYAPFFISSANYGFFVENTWPGVFDFCKENNGFVRIAFEGPAFNFKIYTSGNPLDIVRRHALEAGPSFTPPSWAFGPWRWRDVHSNNTSYYDGTPKKAPYNTDIVEDVLMMKALDIPCTALWIDRPWATGPNGFDDYEFDTSRFPDPEGMIRWLNSKNMELMIWIAPFVMGKMAEYAKANNYFLISKMHGNTPGQVLMDFTNPDAVKWWSENGPAKLAKMGVRGFKLDRADGEKLTDSLHLITHAGTNYRENYNDFPRQYVKATYDAVQPVLGDNFILFPRSQYTGSARYGGMWAGDTDGKPEGLRSAIIGLQRCAIMGYPVWASDIGGYWGAFSRETTMRWLAFGCFSPLMEVGPTNNMAFWSNPGEPHYDTQLIATWRLYTKTRMKLVEYISGLAAEAHNDGTPIVRPLFLMFPDQEEAWEDWQTYMLGPDILVSAIWEKNITEQNLYLPEGETWIDAWSPENEYEGGSYITVDAPLYKIPVFVRKGSMIDLGDLNKLYAESLEIATSVPDLKQLEIQEGWQ